MQNRLVNDGDERHWVRDWLPAKAKGSRDDEVCGEHRDLVNSLRRILAKLEESLQYQSGELPVEGLEPVLCIFADEAEHSCEWNITKICKTETTCVHSFSVHHENLALTFLCLIAEPFAKPLFKKGSIN